MFLLDIAPLPEEDIYFSAAPLLSLLFIGFLALVVAAVIGVTIFLIIRAVRKNKK